MAIYTGGAFGAVADLRSAHFCALAPQRKCAGRLVAPDAHSKMEVRLCQNWGIAAAFSHGTAVETG